LNALSILFKPIVLVYNVLSMEGRQNMWSPWYLMLGDKPRKVAIDIMAMGELELQCVQRHIHE
jgi:hypothetical protein